MNRTYRFTSALLLLISAGINGSVAIAQPPLAYAAYTNEALNFTVDLPGSWVAEEKDQTLVFSGQRGSEQWQTTINFQLVEGGGQNIASVVAELKSQWAGFDPAYRLTEEQSGLLDEHAAQRLLVEYQDKSHQALIRQEQFVAQYPDYFYLIAYTAPFDLYDQYHAAMDRVLKSFHVLTTEQPGLRPKVKEEKTPGEIILQSKANKPDNARKARVEDKPKKESPPKPSIAQNVIIEWELWRAESPEQKSKGIFNITAGKMKVSSHDSTPAFSKETETGRYSCSEKALQSEGSGRLQQNVITLNTKLNNVDPWRCTEKGVLNGQRYRCESEQNYSSQTDQTITLNYDGTLDAKFVNVVSSHTKTWGDNCDWENSSLISDPQLSHSVGVWKIRE